VLARILDDPTFSVLNSLIYFNQIDIIQHLQNHVDFFRKIFALFSQANTDEQKKKDGVLFIQTVCAIAKTLQAQARAQLYQNLMNCGLLTVITFALRHSDASVRVAGTDILVALIDHDSMMVRGQIFKAINEKTKPLTDILIELLLVEVDLGVKSQMADAIKVLLDPNINGNGFENMIGRPNSEYLAKMGRNPGNAATSQTDTFIQSFYDESAKKLFQPLQDLEKRESMDNFSIQDVNLYTYLVEILSFFVRQHSYRSKQFILIEQLPARVAQLMYCPEKHLKLSMLLPYALFTSLLLTSGSIAQILP
jgi:protein phosphatase 4 regulatory subunit 3